jgi:hypothetical protein
MRRVLAQRAFVAAVVAIAAALALALYLFNGGDGEGWQRVNDDASGIRLSYPREWEVQQVGRYCRRNGPGLLISNVRRYTLQSVEIPNGCTNQWEVSGLPNAYVLVDVSLFASPFPRTRDQPETTMPLNSTASSVHRSDTTMPSNKSHGTATNTACAPGLVREHRARIRTRWRV